MRKEIKKKLATLSIGFLEAKYNLTLWELRLFVEVLQQVGKNDKNLKGYRLYYKDISIKYGKDRGKNYIYIREASQSLLRKVAHFNYTTEGGTERTFSAVLFSGAYTPENWKEEEELMYIDFEINPELKETFIQWQKIYQVYGNTNILRLRSKFAVRIYQILKSYSWQDSESIIVELSVAELREKVLIDDNGEPTNQYKAYAVFKKNVIFQAQKELEEHMDIVFNFEEIKRGRRINAIRFYVHKNFKEKQEN